MFPSIKIKEYTESELCGIFWVKMVTENIVLVSPGIHLRIKISSGLLKCLLFWFRKFCLPIYLQKDFEYFSHSRSHLILAQTFATFDCLCSPWCNFFCKFSIFFILQLVTYGGEVFFLILTWKTKFVHMGRK